MVILHGENIVKSRTELIKMIQTAKEKRKETITLSGEKIDLTTLIQALESRSLFGLEKLVVIENLLQIKGRLRQEILTCLAKHDQQNNLVWWEGKSISPGILKKFSKAKVFNFKISPIIFKFLDSLKPDNASYSLVLLKESLKKDDPEMVFYMLTRQIRLLIQAKDKKADQILKMAPWQKTKLISQANKFALNQLLSLHKQLTKIDYQQKTGQDPYPLSSRLDLFIACL